MTFAHYFREINGNTNNGDILRLLREAVIDPDISYNQLDDLDRVAEHTMQKNDSFSFFEVIKND